MTKETVNTIIISDTDYTVETLENELSGSEFNIIFEATSLQQLMAAKMMKDPELIIVALGETDNKVINTLKVINEQFPLPIVIFTQDDSSDAIEQAIAAGVSGYVVDGLHRHRIQPILKTAIARFKQFQAMQKQVDELKTSLADRKIIDRAKGIIMEQRQCSENEAYKLLRTTAMNRNVKLVALAESILATANLLEPKRNV